MRIDLKGRVFAVTGAAQGIGRAIVASLRTAGAEVGAIDIDAETLDQLPAEIGRFTADLGRRDDAHASIDAVHARYGRLDGLVTAAGGVRGQAGRSIQEITEQDWRVIFEANVDSAMWCAQAAVPHMQQAGSGRIVTISSGAGLRPSLTGIQAYASAKHALVGLTRQLALELGPKGITVNSVAPGSFCQTPLPSGNGRRSVRNVKRRCCRASTCAASERRKISPTPLRSWSRRNRTGSADRSSRSTEATRDQSS